MSLTSQLEDPRSPVRLYMQSEFPELSKAGGRGLEGKKLAQRFRFNNIADQPLRFPVPESVSSKQAHSPIVGTAFDFRARMILADFEIAGTVAAEGLSILHSYREQSRLAEHYANTLIGAVIDAEKAAKTGDESTKDLLALLLAWGETIYRSGSLAFMGQLGDKLRSSRTPQDFIESIEQEKLDDIANLRFAAEGQAQSWKTEIANGARFEGNPVFEGSRLIPADADWIIGETLIDCKTTEKAGGYDIRKMVLQLLGYTLLDFNDELHIRSIAAWLPRREVLQTWSLEELVGSDVENQLPVLRDRFKIALQSQAD